MEEEKEAMKHEFHHRHTGWPIKRECKKNQSRRTASDQEKLEIESRVHDQEYRAHSQKPADVLPGERADDLILDIDVLRY